MHASADRTLPLAAPRSGRSAPSVPLASEVPLCFTVQHRDGAERLIGVLTVPTAAAAADEALAPATRGVLIVTGGPQYRAGSHRQFVLLARALAAQGVPVLRFDYRGMGDSEGAVRDYRAIGDDIDSALAQFFTCVPSLREVVLWGLCDGATAAACHAPRDTRIAGLVLLNPWVRSTSGLARASLRHYYLPRLLQRSFWRKLAGGGVQLRASFTGLRRTAGALAASDGNEPATPALMYQALHRFPGPVLLILSGADLGAREWDDLLATHRPWRRLCAQPTWQRATVPGASHTFASASWRVEVERLCCDWLATW